MLVLNKPFYILQLNLSLDFAQTSPSQAQYLGQTNRRNVQERVDERIQGLSQREMGGDRGHSFPLEESSEIR